MITAFFGLSSRADAAHAALVVADALAVPERRVSLIRITLPGEAALPPRTVASDGVTVLEREAPDATSVADVLAQSLTATPGASREVIADLPPSCIADPTIRILIDLAVATVGASPIAEYEAACLVASLDGRVPAPWLLACGRDGGRPALSAFYRSVTYLAASLGAPDPCRVLPAALPSLTRREAERLADGNGADRTLRAGLAIAAALAAAAADPDALRTDPDAFAKALLAAGEDDRLKDGRNGAQRLHELADELDAIGEGTKPSDDDLADAPRLEDWTMATRPVRVLTGRVFNHPNFPDGRRITSSDLYATDGRSWGRTLSRYFVLANPADGPDGRRAH